MNALIKQIEVMIIEKRGSIFKDCNIVVLAIFLLIFSLGCSETVHDNEKHLKIDELEADLSVKDSLATFSQFRNYSIPKNYFNYTREDKVFFEDGYRNELVMYKILPPKVQRIIDNMTNEEREKFYAR